MEQRRLGRTGHLSSVVTFGTAGIGRVDQETADLAVQTVLDRGVNHFDVAPRYGEAEVRLRPWMPRIRKQIFLGCKTGQRTRDAAKAELERSLERLGTDRLDLYQLHAVGKLHELDECTAKGGALETLLEAREAGITRWLGITGHTHDAPRTHLEALRRFDFDTVMFPLNFVLWSNPQYRQDAEALLEDCRRRDVGVHIIKTVAKNPWGDRPKTHATWYEPFTDQATIDRAVAFVLSQPVTTLTSVGDVTVLPKVLSAAERFRPLDAAAQEALLAMADQYHSPFVGSWA
ncbi:MAG: aldo/keto reductase [candidate division NC10 bacterium RBG_16_65_8]|nr:MAG: aldo/keto reductase [candidate division NC10 bacterium RBG_16_65_8]